MYRFVVLAAVCALVAARASFPAAQREFALNSIHTDFTGGEESSQALLENNLSINGQGRGPIGHVQLTAVASGDNLGVPYRYIYTFGKRVKGDHLAAAGTGANSWPTPQNLTLTLHCPPIGKSASITFVEVVLDQTSELSAATVTGGGIGQNSITVVATANETYSIGYYVGFYVIYKDVSLQLQNIV